MNLSRANRRERANHRAGAAFGPLTRRRGLAAGILLLAGMLLPISAVSGRASGADKGSDEAHDRVAQVLQHRGGKVIERCRIAYTVDSTRPAPTEAVLKERIKEHKTFLEGEIARAESETQRGGSSEPWTVSTRTSGGN